MFERKKEITSNMKKIIFVQNLLKISFVSVKDCFGSYKHC